MTNPIDKLLLKGPFKDKTVNVLLTCDCPGCQRPIPDCVCNKSNVKTINIPQKVVGPVGPRGPMGCPGLSSL